MIIFSVAPIGRSEFIDLVVVGLLKMDQLGQLNETPHHQDEL